MPTSAPAYFDDPLNLLRMHAAAVVVDVHAVRLVVRYDHLRAEFAQNARRRFVGGAICDIDSRRAFLRATFRGKTRLGEFHVAAERVIDARGASDFVRGRPNRIDLAAENELLDFFLDLIVELVAIVPEKFDAVILVGIMRSGENDAGIGAQRPRDVSHTRRRQRSDDENIDTERSDSGHERVFQHVTGKTRVFSEHDFRTRAVRRSARIQLCEHMRGGAAKFQRGFRRDRLDVRDAAHAIRSKNFLLLGHGLIETLKARFVNGKLSSASHG